MLKKVKQHGNSEGITFTKEEKEIYKIHLGDILELEIKNVRKAK